MLHRLASLILDRLGYLTTLARLHVLDWVAGPQPETPTDRAIREQRERLRTAFPPVEYDDPSHHVGVICDFKIWRAA